MINTFSGRANFLIYRSKRQSIVVPILFSTELVLTIIQTTPPFLLLYEQMGGKKVLSQNHLLLKKPAMSQYMTYMTITIGSVLAVAAYLNDDEDDDKGVSFDPRSTDFLKIKLGNTRVDPFGEGW